MDTTKIKKEIKSYIDKADERVLSMVYTLLAEETSDYEVPEEHKKIIKQRLTQYKTNRKSTLTWEEVVENARKAI